MSVVEDRQAASRRRVATVEWASPERLARARVRGWSAAALLADGSVLYGVIEPATRSASAPRIVLCHLPDVAALASRRERLTGRRRALLVVLPADKVLTKDLSLPTESLAEVEQMLAHEVETLSPFGAERTQYSYVLMPSPQAGRTAVRCFLVEQAAVEEACEPFATAGIPVRALLPSVLAGVAGLRGLTEMHPGQLYVVCQDGVAESLTVRADGTVVSRTGLLGPFAAAGGEAGSTPEQQRLGVAPETATIAETATVAEIADIAGGAPANGGSVATRGGSARTASVAHGHAGGDGRVDADGRLGEDLAREVLTSLSAISPGASQVHVAGLTPQAVAGLAERIGRVPSDRALEVQGIEWAALEAVPEALRVTALRLAGALLLEQTDSEQAGRASIVPASYRRDLQRYGAIRQDLHWVGICVAAGLLAAAALAIGNARMERLARQTEAQIAPHVGVASQVAAKREQLTAARHQLDSRDLPLRILTSLAEVTPSGVFFYKVSLAADNTVVVDGVADSLHLAFEFPEYLKKCPLFTQIQLNYAQQSKAGEQSVVEFRCTCRARRLAPEGRP